MVNTNNEVTLTDDQKQKLMESLNELSAESLNSEQGNESDFTSSYEEAFSDETRLGLFGLIKLLFKDMESEELSRLLEERGMFGALKYMASLNKESLTDDAKQVINNIKVDEIINENIKEKLNNVLQKEVDYQLILDNFQKISVDVNDISNIAQIGLAVASSAGILFAYKYLLKEHVRIAQPIEINRLKGSEKNIALKDRAHFIKSYNKRAIPIFIGCFLATLLIPKAINVNLEVDMKTENNSVNTSYVFLLSKIYNRLPF